MKMRYCFLFMLLIFKSVVNAYNLNEDPQKEDMNLQREQTRDFQFREDQNFQQERELGR